MSISPVHPSGVSMLLCKVKGPMLGHPAANQCTLLVGALVWQGQNSRCEIPPSPVSTKQDDVGWVSTPRDAQEILVEYSPQSQFSHVQSIYLERSSHETCD